MQMPVNPFDVRAVAERYSQGRFFFHDVVIDRVHQKLQLSHKVRRALDIGCGTGLSARALVGVAEQVDAIDASQSMLDCAFRHSDITYRLMRAGGLSFPDATFDLITLCQVLQWLDQELFFKEARRIVKRDGHIVIYDNFFLWDSESDLREWFRDRYESRFPPPVKRASLTGNGELVPEGFAFDGYEAYSVPTALTLKGLIDHLMTGGSVSAAVDQRGGSVRDAVQWLENELRPFFLSTPTILFPFGGFIYYLKKL
jgi:SAM-dependent methyltransferase